MTFVAFYYHIVAYLFLDSYSPSLKIYRYFNLSVKFLLLALNLWMFLFHIFQTIWHVFRKKHPFSKFKFGLSIATFTFIENLMLSLQFFVELWEFIGRFGVSDVVAGTSGNHEPGRYWILKKDPVLHAFIFATSIMILLGISEYRKFLVGMTQFVVNFAKYLANKMGIYQSYAKPISIFPLNTSRYTVRE